MIGLINIQYAVARGELYVIEANPRASRTVPFVSKAVGAPLAKIACRLMLGERLADQDLPEMPTGHISVKEAVLPFQRFAGADSVLGPEMKSTGEVMGVAADFPTAFGKAQAAAGVELPTEGTLFITVTDDDKAAATQIAARFHDLGFRIIATAGTAQAISRMGVPVVKINKIGEGSPHVVDYITRGEVDMVINTPTGSGARSDGYEIRNAAVRHGLPCITTMTGASAAARAIFAQRTDQAEPRSLQELHAASAGREGRDLTAAGRVLAPPGRRACEVTGGRDTGGYRIFTVLDPEGPDPEAGQFYMLTAAGWGTERGRPYLPRAFSFATAERVEGGVELDSCSRPSARAPRVLAALEPGERIELTGPLGRPFSTPRELNPKPRARSSSAAASGSLRLPSGVPRSPAAASPTRALLGFRDRAHAGGTELFDCSEVRLASEDGHAGPPRLRHRPARGPARGRGRRPQRRRLRLRAAGDAGGGAADVRGSRRRLRARDGVADGLRVRRLLRLRGAARRGRVHAPVRGRAGRPRRGDRNRPGRRGGTLKMAPALGIDLCGLRLEHPVLNGSGTFDAIAARRAFGDALLERFPFSAFVSKTITPNPAPATRRRASTRRPRGWSTRSAFRTRAWRGSCGTTCRCSPSCRCRSWSR